MHTFNRIYCGFATKFTAKEYVMSTRISKKKRILQNIVMIAFVIPFIFPLISVIARSAQGEGFILNYKAVFLKSPFFQFAANSLYIAFFTVLITFIATMLSAYAFSKINFRGRSTLFILLLGGLVLPGIALVVPLFIMVAKLGAFNTYWAVIIPLAAGAIPFNLLLAKNYMDSIQNEIVEAAEIDGCNKFQVFLRIILPLSKPISSVIVIWTFLASWNEFFLPVLFIQDPTKQTVAQVPQYFSSIYISDYPKIFAALIMISLPTLILYLVFQKNFERGLSAGAVK